MPEQPKFEESLKALEKLVEELEGGDLDLDEALKRFEKGVALSKQLHASLEEAGRKVEKLMVGPDGDLSREALDESEEDGEEGPKKGKGKKPKGSQDSLF